MISNFPLATVINFCSNDYPFLRDCIEAVKPFSTQILIPVCDHFFDGVKEDREILNRIYAENPDVQFIEFPFDEKKSLYGSHSSLSWHNLARMIGRFFLKNEIEYVLFLDCDEIVDSERFAEWMNTFPYGDFDALHLANYWYFRECHLQAKSWEHTPLLVKKELLDGALIMNACERAGMYDLIAGNKANGALGLDGNPMVHHYSWVRTKEQLLRKVVSWSHCRDRDWVSLVEEEFSRPFNGTDFVHGYEFIEVPPFKMIDLLKKPEAFNLKTAVRDGKVMQDFEPESVPLGGDIPHVVKAPPNGTDSGSKDCVNLPSLTAVFRFKDCDFSHVRKLTHEEVIKIDVSLTYQIPLCL